MMNSKCVQALSPGLSEAKSPESLYLKDENARMSQGLATKDVPVITFTKDTSSPKCTDVSLKQALEKNGEVSKFGESARCPNFEAFGKFEDASGGLGEFMLGMSEVDVLRDDLSEASSPESSPSSTLLSPGSMSPTTPIDSLVHFDGNTQMSLCEQSEAMQLEETFATLNAEDINEIVNEISQSLPSPSLTDMLAEESPRKARKTSSNSDAPSSASSQVVTAPAAFDAGSAMSSPQFNFTQFGKDVPVFTYNSHSREKTNTSGITARTISGTTASTKLTPASEGQRVTLVMPNCTRKPLREPSLNMSFPAKNEGTELKVLVQPEDNHRARYMTEGSRGAVKDKSQQAFPVVELKGVDKPVKLQVFIGNDTGKVKPHGFYQACKVCGKTASQCQERDIEGTTVIEIPLEPNDDMSMQARIDCVGILKLRNADVEKRIGLARSKRKSTCVRLVFRVNIPREDGTGFRTVQVTSNKISCTQPAGQPEITKKSLKEGSVNGGEELFIIGKNFTKGTKVVFQQIEGSTVSWQDYANLDMELFQPNHLVCTIPPYKDANIQKPVEVQVLVQCSGRCSEPHTYTYRPAITVSDDDVKMQENVTDSQPECVSPEAVKLNKTYTEAILAGKTKNKLMDAVATPVVTKVSQQEQPPVASQQTSDVLKGLLLQLQQIQEAQRQLANTKVKDMKPLLLQPQPASIQQQPTFTVQPTPAVTLQDLQAWMAPNQTVTVQPQQPAPTVAQPATTPDGAQPASAAPLQAASTTPMVLTIQQPAAPTHLATSATLWNLLTSIVNPQPVPVTNVPAKVDGKRQLTDSNALESGPLVAGPVANLTRRGVMPAPLVDGSLAAVTVAAPQTGAPIMEADLQEMSLPQFTGEDVDQLLNLLVNGGAATS